METPKKMAVLVGCNYSNTRNELHGCINDVLAMQDALMKWFGFERSHIELLTDAPGSTVMPTGENIKKALGRMVDKAEPGDVLFFHYSGHGTQLPSIRPHQPHRRHEAIVPCDFNLITDIDFRQIVNRVPNGASFTILSDSCHSGGLIDKEKEQIGASAYINTTKSHSLSRKLKTIPLDEILEYLSSITRISTPDIGTHLLQIFGSEASLRFLTPLLQHDTFRPLQPDEGILLSGCQANETSADMSPMEGHGMSYGAFSNAVQIVLKENHGFVSNKQLVIFTRKVLEAQGFEQHPCLYCSDENADTNFLQLIDNKTI